MERKIITIDDTGVVNIPSGGVKMSEYEIAELFDVGSLTIRRRIKRLMKTRTDLDLDLNHGIVVVRCVIPIYFGLEVIVAIAMEIESKKADIFRRYILRRITSSISLPLYLQLLDNSSSEGFN